MNKTNLTLITASLFMLQCNAASIPIFKLSLNEEEGHLRNKMRQNIVGVTGPIKTSKMNNNEELCSYFGLPEKVIKKIAEKVNIDNDKSGDIISDCPKD